jgi:hypothetical protein
VHVVAHSSARAVYPNLSSSYCAPRIILLRLTIGVSYLAVWDLLNRASIALNAHAVVLTGVNLCQIVSPVSKGYSIRQCEHTRRDRRSNGESSHGENSGDDGGELHFD